MSDPKRVSPAEAKALLDQGFTYLDVRSEHEFAAGHPAGALNVPFAHAGPQGMTPNHDFLPVVQALFPSDAALVLGCAAGGRSLAASRALAAAGYTRLVDQRAGFGGARNPFGQVVEEGWAGAGLPVETGAATGGYAELKARAGR
jgi:rhodanese-related sulfurtransferase